jgi:hypothetical protein
MHYPISPTILAKNYDGTQAPFWHSAHDLGHAAALRPGVRFQARPVIDNATASATRMPSIAADMMPPA